MRFISCIAFSWANVVRVVLVMLLLLRHLLRRRRTAPLSEYASKVYEYSIIIHSIFSFE